MSDEMVPGRLESIALSAQAEAATLRAQFAAATERAEKAESDAEAAIDRWGSWEARARNAEDRAAAETRRADEEAAGAAAMRTELERLRAAADEARQSVGDFATAMGYADRVASIDRALASDAGRAILDRLRATESARVTAEALVLAHEGRIEKLTAELAALLSELDEETAAFAVLESAMQAESEACRVALTDIIASVAMLGSEDRTPAGVARKVAERMLEWDAATEEARTLRTAIADIPECGPCPGCGEVHP